MKTSMSRHELIMKTSMSRHELITRILLKIESSDKRIQRELAIILNNLSKIELKERYDSLIKSTY